MSFNSNENSKWNHFKAALRSPEPFNYFFWFKVALACCFDSTIRAMGPVLIVVASGLISIISLLFFVFILPEVTKDKSFWRYLNGSFGAFILFNIFWNYFLCIGTNPGIPATKKINKPITETEDNIPLKFAGEKSDDGNAVSRSRPNRFKEAEYVDIEIGGIERLRSDIQHNSIGAISLRCGFCKKCNKLKPVRTHHCHVCNKCILNMDHHCPWINNCVGYYNYRFFVLFLIYLFIGCLYMITLTTQSFLSIIKSQGGQVGSIKLEATTSSAIQFGFVMSLSTGFGVGVLLMWHLYLISTAQTTIEFYKNQSRRNRCKESGENFVNVFDRGLRANWEQVFGQRSVMLWGLPSRRLPPPPLIPFGDDQVSSLPESCISDHLSPATTVQLI